MSALVSRAEWNRRGLAQAILRVLESWPATHRQVFVQSHYAGLSMNRVACAVGMGTDEVRRILDQCGRDLRSALRGWREQKSACALAARPSAARFDPRRLAC